MARQSKGARYERDFAKWLSIWWSYHQTDDWFWRSHNSGGRATMRRKAGRATFKQAGDIAATHPKGMLLLEVISFELKCGYPRAIVSDAFDKLPHHRPQLWETFWRQAKWDAKANGSWSWMLITNRDRRLPMSWIPRKLAYGLRSVGVPLPPIRFRYGRSEVFGIPTAEWFESVEPDDIRDLAEMRGIKAPGEFD